MWLVAVVGLCVVECEHCVLAPYNAKPHNCNQPHPAPLAQTPYAAIRGLCSPDDGHNDARNTLRQ